MADIEIINGKHKGLTNLSPMTPERGRKLAATMALKKEKRQQIEAIATQVAKLENQIIQGLADKILSIAKRTTVPALMYLVKVVQDEDCTVQQRINAAKAILALGHASSTKFTDVSVHHELPGGLAQMEPGKNYGHEYLLERIQIISRALTGHAPQIEDIEA